MTHLLTLPGLLTLASLAACTDPAAPAARPVAGPVAAGWALRTASYAGEYSLGGDPQQDPVGSLLVYPESDSTVLFYLDLNNGPPAFHVGSLYRRVVVRAGTALCAFKESYKEKACQLKITFTPRAAVIKTVSGANGCGFAERVNADSTYPRISTAVPMQFTTGEGTTLKCSEITPEKYNAASE